MDTVKEKVNNVVEAFGGNKARVVLELGESIVDAALSKRESYRAKLSALSKHSIKGWQYNEIILKYFVKRTFKYYGSDKAVSIDDIRAELERQKLARNVILTGQAGAGKSTALKWLFLHSNIRGYSSIYLCASMFDSVKSLQDVLAKIADAISSKNSCVVFFDGLDELKCIKGNSDEFETIIHFFDSKGNDTGTHRFVISTRPEHFDFQKLIVKKHTKRALDHYAVYEIQMLTRRETLEVCKSIEKLSKFDEKWNFSHFKDKWPSTEMDAIAKSEYLSLLKKYINESEDNTLLASPLLCRYAYPIVREWNVQGTLDTNAMRKEMSAQIHYALESYIKWEFHDNYQGPTIAGEGKKCWEEYKKNVFLFLTQVAGTMGLDNIISKSQWELHKVNTKITGNAAFCVLQEYADESMAFIHQSFKDYFLACYYADVLKRSMRRSHQVTRRDASILAVLMESNSLFSVMYVEQLCQSNNKLIDKVCRHILTAGIYGSYEGLAELARGKRQYRYTSETPFTVEEYLKVFPYGDINYYGIIFNKDTLHQLQLTGILEIQYEADFSKCKVEEICKRITIKGVKHLRMSWNGYKHTTISFQLVHSNVFTSVGGYWKASTSKADIEAILLRTEFQNMLSCQGISKNELVSNEIVQRALWEKKLQDRLRHEAEDEDLHRWIENVIGLMGREKNYWCLFDKASLVVYEIDPENEIHMQSLFLQGMRDKPADYLSMYGTYKAFTENLEVRIQESDFKEASMIMTCFDASKCISLHQADVLDVYYNIHWKNLKLLKMVQEELLEEKDRILQICDILMLYKAADKFLEKISNEKLILLFSDERLITYYLSGDGEEMVDLAEKTLVLCDKFYHQKGKAFRDFLMADDTCFVGKDVEKVYEFARDYIWI